MSQEVKITISSDAQIQNLTKARDELQKLSDNAKKAGLDTSELDEALKKSNESLGQASLEKYANSLKVLIEQERAAGHETAELEEKLSKIQNLKPSSKWAEAFEELTAAIPGASAANEALGGNLLKVAASAEAVREAIRFAGEAVEEFAQKQALFAKLDISLANTGQLTDEMHEKLQAMAETMSEKTGHSVEEFLAAQQKLILMGGANADTIDRQMDLTKKLAGVMGIDIPSAAQELVRAMQGHTRQLELAGIHIDHNLKGQARWNALAKELDTKGFGILEEQLKTIDGQFTNLKTSYGEMLQSFGSALYDSGIVTFLTEIAKGWDMIFTDLSGGSKVAVLKNLHNAEGEVKTGMDDAGTSADEFGDHIEAAAKKGKDALQEELDKLKEIQQQQDEMTNASMAKDLAKLDLEEAKALGKSGLSAEDKASIKLDFKEKKEKVRSDAEIKKAQDDISALTNQVNVILGEMAKSQSARESDNANLSSASSNLESSKGQFKNFSDQGIRKLIDPSHIESLQKQLIDISNAKVREGTTPEMEKSLAEDEKKTQAEITQLIKLQAAQKEYDRIKSDVDKNEQERVAAEAKDKDNLKKTRAKVDVSSINLETVQTKSQATFQDISNEKKDAASEAQKKAKEKADAAQKKQLEDQKRLIEEKLKNPDITADEANPLFSQLSGVGNKLAQLGGDDTPVAKQLREDQIKKIEAEVLARISPNMVLQTTQNGKTSEKSLMGNASQQQIREASEAFMNQQSEHVAITVSTFQQIAAQLQAMNKQITTIQGQMKASR